MQPSINVAQPSLLSVSKRHQIVHAHMAGGREEEGGKGNLRGEPTDRASFFFLSLPRAVEEGGEGRRGEHLLKRDIDIPPFPSSLISAAIFHLSLALSLWPKSQREREGGAREGALPT